MSGGGRNNRSYRIGRLHTWPLRSKLSLIPSNRTGVDGTYGGEIRRIRNKGGKMAKDLRDSRKKDELITGRRILIDIKNRSDEVKREVYGEVL